MDWSKLIEAIDEHAAHKIGDTVYFKNAENSRDSKPIAFKFSTCWSQTRAKDCTTFPRACSPQSARPSWSIKTESMTWRVKMRSDAKRVKSAGLRSRR